ncbi:hypothetical protein PISMIDRAFT_494935 [Pisolithus microcarpus 441]|uniref:Uncharacterized protein n=1 Tax=Pisolithus microcarpus 441 TaxID=765257 RepID=A0A0C9YCB4_9AGAM|nr:hypothetical protein BKA83DRAFT_494935 [Pisolithus microcarpus]KIK11494.1 hypothetical protein PISMIDRAFT_494935 [Pisolithus microcarpus 441]
MRPSRDGDKCQRWSEVKMYSTKECIVRVSNTSPPPSFLALVLTFSPFLPATCLPRHCHRHGTIYHFMFCSRHRHVPFLYHLVYTSASRSCSCHLCCTWLICVVCSLLTVGARSFQTG